MLDALKGATLVPPVPGADAEPLTLTVTLKRTDQAGFERYLHEVYDPHSPRFRHFLSQAQITARFGPSQGAYDQVRTHLEQSGFTVTEPSANRLTLTVRGTRAQADRAFAVGIRDYALHGHAFYANEDDPELPKSIADYVASVSGLSNLGAPAAPNWDQTYQGNRAGDCDLYMDFVQGTKKVAGFGVALLVTLELAPLSWYCAGYFFAIDPAKAKAASAFDICKDRSDLSVADIEACARQGNKAEDPPPGTPAQKIGLLEFDTFRMGDVADWLTLVKKDATAVNRVSVVPVNGGVPNPGAGESEVLLDIDTVIGLTEYIPNTSYAVYVAPPSTSFQQLFNAMINDGVTIISNSWAQCEDQTSLADAQSIDAVLAQAAASGISVFNGSGDSGSTCLDGSANTVGVPADSPHATAVGGTSPTFGPALTYGSETWWNGAGQVPPGGRGGFGVSRYFPRPTYQNGLTPSTMRSVPDLALAADPRVGLSICQADAGGCPTGLLYGGTSVATPTMAALTAVVNTSLGYNIGEANPVLYPLAGTDAFNAVAGFANVGLGSPNIDHIRLKLSGQTVGAATDANSLVWSSALPIATDGSVGYVRVDLYDANLYPVSGKTVTLAASPGSHAVINPASGISSQNGSVVFAVTDTAIEDLMFTATDVTDAVTLTIPGNLSFVAPPATAGGISASPNTVPANGTSTTTITVTLQDATGKPTPGKLVTISQGAGHSIITAPLPAVTDANGLINFQATDDVGETVTYTAVDVTDGNLPVPGSAPVTYTGAGASCVTSPPTAAAGFTLTPFATGFAAQNFFYSNVNWSGCPGASNPAFDTAGNVFVSDFFNGALYQLGPSGGAASTADTLAIIGLTLQQPAFGKDGSLYVARGATGSGFNSGVVLRVDPDTGGVLQTVVTGLTCPSPLAVDPLSGDVFFTDTCFGAGADDPSLWRIQNPASASPSLVVYATLPSTPNGPVVFAPNGTMYVVNDYNGTGNIIQITGTSLPSPPVMTTLAGISSDFWITMGEVQANGAAKSLLVHNNNALKLVDITTGPFTTTVLANGSLGSGTIGPDGCIYAEASDTIFKVAPAAGQCTFAPTNPAPALALTPTSVSPNPAQGTSTTFTATLRNVSQPQGTPITFLVGGANSVVKMVRADSNGQATFSYPGVFTGIDTIVAKATLDSEAPISNSAQVTWGAGRHTTFLTLNPSPTAGTLGQPVTVTASLIDISSTPVATIANGSITFTLGNSACPGVTDANGLASCTVTPDMGGLLSLTAAFQGTANYVGSTASAAFNARATLASAPTIGSASGGPGDVTVTFTPPSNNGGSPITSFTVTCTPVAGGAPASQTGSASPITVGGLTGGVTYTCTVSATNAVGTGPASGASNAVTPAAGTGVSTAIPTLSPWALIVLAILLGMFASAVVRRRQ